VWLSILRPFVPVVPAFVAEAKSQSRVGRVDALFPSMRFLTQRHAP
jgi:hypothetical protein